MSYNTPLNVDTITVSNILSDDVLTLNPDSTVTQLGGQVTSRTSVTDDYTCVLTDNILGVNGLSAGITITLPAIADAAIPQFFTVKDENGTAALYSITIQCNAAETIDGLNTYIMTAPFGSVTFYNNGTQWSFV